MPQQFRRNQIRYGKTVSHFFSTSSSFYSLKTKFHAHIHAYNGCSHVKRDLKDKKTITEAPEYLTHRERERAIRTQAQTHTSLFHRVLMCAGMSVVEVYGVRVVHVYTHTQSDNDRF